MIWMGISISVFWGEGLVGDGLGEAEGYGVSRERVSAPREQRPQCCCSCSIYGLRSSEVGRRVNLQLH